MWIVSKDVRGKIDCSLQRRPIVFMAFLFFHLHGTEMLIYGITLNEDVFELWLVQ